MAGYQTSSPETQYQTSSPGTQYQTSSPETQYQPLQYAEGLEVAPSSGPEWVAGGPQTEIEGKIPAEEEGKILADSGISEDATPWWKKKRFLLGLGAVVITILVGLGVGLGVGLTRGKGDDVSNGESNEKSTEDASDDTPPDCKDTLCPSILSVPIYQSALHILARTSNNTIAYRCYNGSSWDDWFDLGETTGKLISQPSAMTWRVKKEIPRLDVVAVSTSEYTVYGRWKSEDEGWAAPEWHGLGPSAGSAVALCVYDEDRLDLWMVDRGTRNITHTYWYQYADEDISDKGQKGDTSVNGEFLFPDGWAEQPFPQPSRSTPAVACRDSSIYHDVLWYADEDGSLYHAYYNLNRDGAWRVSTPWKGDWIGDPTIYAPPDDPERWEFFGVQSNNQMYHLTRTQDGYSSLNKLGGSILSVPAVVSLDQGAYDVVALGTNGTLQHRHFDGSGWSTAWEDLGVRAHSAPAMALLDGQLFIAAVAKNGTLQVWTRDDSLAEEWKDSLEVTGLGGDLTLDFFTDAS